MSINAVKGVEIGDGFDVVNQKGSQHRDPLSPQGFGSNHAGGILGGISTGQDIVANIALKPTSSITVPVTRSLKKVKPLSSLRKVVTTHVSAFVLYLLLKPCWRLL